LQAAGWRCVRLPPGLTLARLHAAGAPFKGARYFEVQARQTVEYTTVDTDLAYPPGLLPGSYNLPFEAAEQLVAQLAPQLPPGTAATIAPAAAYVWLLEHHRCATGSYPFTQRYTWAVDRYQERAHLAVGVFGQHRPLLVVPLPEGRGAGVGVWPVVVPRAALPALWPPAPGASGAGAGQA
ncbi:MAG TPA: hypothetical protein VNM50_03165, partial [Chloroflexota bacterium]|nr:hypothetical protein [Chloroflexota bacterium]